MVAVALHPEVRPVDLPSVEEHIHQLKQAAAARASKGAGSPQDGVPTQRYLPPPEVAKNIPCRFFPNCSYGDSCIFFHPSPAQQQQQQQVYPIQHYVPAAFPFVAPAGSHDPSLPLPGPGAGAASVTGSPEPSSVDSGNNQNNTAVAQGVDAGAHGSRPVTSGERASASGSNGVGEQYAYMQDPRFYDPSSYMAMPHQMGHLQQTYYMPHGADFEGSSSQQAAMSAAYAAAAGQVPFYGYAGNGYQPQSAYAVSASAAQHQSQSNGLGASLSPTSSSYPSLYNATPQLSLPSSVAGRNSTSPAPSSGSNPSQAAVLDDPAIVAQSPQQPTTSPRLSTRPTASASSDAGKPAGSGTSSPSPPITGNTANSPSSNSTQPLSPNGSVPAMHPSFSVFPHQHLPHPHSPYYPVHMQMPLPQELQQVQYMYASGHAQGSSHGHNNFNSGGFTSASSRPNGVAAPGHGTQRNRNSHSHSRQNSSMPVSTPADAVSDAADKSQPGKSTQAPTAGLDDTGESSSSSAPSKHARAASLQLHTFFQTGGDSPAVEDQTSQALSADPGTTTAPASNHTGMSDGVSQAHADSLNSVNARPSGPAGNAASAPTPTMHPPHHKRASFGGFGSNRGGPFASAPPSAFNRAAAYVRHMDPSKPVPACSFFAKSECRYGDFCLFVHLLNEERPIPGNPEGRMTRDAKLLKMNIGSPNGDAAKHSTAPPKPPQYPGFHGQSRHFGAPTGSSRFPAQSVLNHHNNINDHHANNPAAMTSNGAAGQERREGPKSQPQLDSTRDSGDVKEKFSKLISETPRLGNGNQPESRSPVANAASTNGSATTAGTPVNGPSQQAQAPRQIQAPHPYANNRFNGPHSHPAQRRQQQALHQNHNHQGGQMNGNNAVGSGVPAGAGVFVNGAPVKQNFGQRIPSGETDFPALGSGSTSPTANAHSVSTSAGSTGVSMARAGSAGGAAKKEGQPSTSSAESHSVKNESPADKPESSAAHQADVGRQKIASAADASGSAGQIGHPPAAVPDPKSQQAAPSAPTTKPAFSWASAAAKAASLPDPPRRAPSKPRAPQPATKPAGDDGKDTSLLKGSSATPETDKPAIRASESLDSEASPVQAVQA